MTGDAQHGWQQMLKETCCLHFCNHISFIATTSTKVGVCLLLTGLSHPQPWSRTPLLAACARHFFVQRCSEATCSFEACAPSFSRAITSCSQTAGLNRMKLFRMSNHLIALYLFSSMYNHGSFLHRHRIADFQSFST